MARAAGGISRVPLRRTTGRGSAGRRAPVPAARRALAVRRIAGLLAFALLGVPSVSLASEPDDVVTRAREASAAGRRAEGLEMLEVHLAQAPRDVDARLVYGLMLSWEGRHDDARRELEQVLAQAPGYTDARAALMNVEWWSGHDAAALAHAREILAEQPHHPQARLVEERISGRERPWTLTASYTFDWFDDSRDPWHETALAVGRQTPVGSVTLRAYHAERFETSDQLIELDAYPRFRPGTYAYVGVGVATRAELYPTYRVGVDLYQSLPCAFEVSAGYRRLEFSDPADIVVGSLSKYLGNWMLTGRVYHVPASGDRDSTSYFGSVRRYFGEAGTSFVGLRYGHGLSREEVRNESDLVDLDSDSLTLAIDTAVWGRFRLALSTGFVRQERAAGGELWQVTFATSVGVQF